MKKKLLVVVDMQNDFISGPLGTDEAQGIVPRVCQKIREWEGDILFTQDTHFDNYLQTREGCNLLVPHCIEGTAGHKINAYVDEAAQELMLKDPSRRIMTKQKNVFGDYELFKDVPYRNYEEVMFVGLCTDICVISNAIIAKAFLPDTYILVDASCCAGTTPEMHEAALDVMRACQIGIVYG